MNQQIRTICGLLESDRPELQCAAALVLGELGIRDPAVIERLGNVLANGTDEHVKSFALDALAKIGSRRSVPFLLPLLDPKSLHLERAVRVLADLGAAVATDLAALRKDAKPGRRRAINVALARLRGATGTRLLLDALQDDDAGVVDAALAAIRHEIHAAPKRERAAFRERVRDFLKSRATRASDRAIAAALRLLGFLDDPKAQAIVLPYTAPRFSSTVRGAALAALRSMPRPKGKTDALARRLMPLLEDADHANIVAPAMELLLELKLPRSLAPQIEELTGNKRRDVRRFVLRKLADFDSRTSSAILLKFLHDDDPAIRDLAAESLTNVPSSREVLFERMMRDTDADRLWLFARILRPHAAAIAPEQSRRLAERAVRLLDTEDRRYEPILFLLCGAAPHVARVALLHRARRKKRARQLDEAARTLRLLERNELFDAEVRYELAVVLWKLTGHAKPEPRGDGRAADPALDLFLGLVPERDLELFERLRREPALSPDDLYALGLHFSEQPRTPRSDDERALGGELLRLVARKAPHAPVARLAREKLQEEG
jgi:hypothetical protein